jgi:hypothetical protein
MDNFLKNNFFWLIIAHFRKFILISFLILQ